jgi:hypothetical protein
LRIGELGLRGIDWLRVELFQICERFRIASMQGAKQVFGLVAELGQVGINRKSSSGHNEPP